MRSFVYSSAGTTQPTFHNTTRFVFSTDRLFLLSHTPSTVIYRDRTPATLISTHPVNPTPFLMSIMTLLCFHHTPKTPSPGPSMQDGLNRLSNAILAPLSSSFVSATLNAFLNTYVFRPTNLFSVPSLLRVSKSTLVEPPKIESLLSKRGTLHITSNGKVAHNSGMY